MLQHDANIFSFALRLIMKTGGGAGVFTGVVDGVPHLVAADAPRLVGAVVLEDPLRRTAGVTTQLEQHP